MEGRIEKEEEEEEREKMSALFFFPKKWYLGSWASRK